jgi:catechol 2,3-dioxygenase-like lactoylglutathione lyase family enzyme
MPELTTAHPARHPSPTVKAAALSYLAFERPDLARVEAFLSDFGLVLARRSDDVLYMRGTSSQPFCYRVHRGSHARFLGAGFAVRSRDDLERLARIDGASGVEKSVHLGGGEQVVLRDPSGFMVEVVHGQAPVEEKPPRAPLAFNVGAERKRVNGTQRLPLAPAEAIRLGHYVLEVADFQATCAWYAQHLGFVPSDVQVLPDGSPAVVFMRLDLGDTPTDHHTLALAQGFLPQFSHGAFEVVDADAVGMGQRFLREQGWTHSWGIGRHILGSQIFDYWQDPWGDKHEHYCDGDLFTADVPMGIHVLSREGMAQWGQPMPRSFTRPHFTPRALASAVRNVRRIPDLDLQKLLTLARIFG